MKGSTVVAGIAVGVGAVALGGALVYAMTKGNTSSSLTVFPTRRTTILEAPRYTYDPYGSMRHKWNGLPWTRRVSVSSAYQFPHPAANHSHRPPFRH